LESRLQEITHELPWVGGGFAALVEYTYKDSFVYLKPFFGSHFLPPFLLL